MKRFGKSIFGTRYRPDVYWEERAQDLIAAYNAPETWAERGWMQAGLEESRVPEILYATGAESAFVVGAGTGRQYSFLQPLGISLQGIDISPSLANECARNFPTIRTVVDTVVGAHERYAPCDAVLSTAVLQHVPPGDFQSAIRSVQALAARTVVVRELSWLARSSDYTWAHDLSSPFADWHNLVDEVTDRAETFEVRLRAWTRLA